MIKNSKLKLGLILITYALLLYFLALNAERIWSIIGRVMIILSPFICGFVLSYLINRPFVFFEEKVYGGLTTYQSGKYQKLRTPLALISSYLCVFGVIVFLVMIIVPQLTLSVNQLISNFSQYLNSLETFIYDLMQKLGIDETSIKHIKNVLFGFIKNFDQLINAIFPHLFNFTKSFTSGVYNWIIGIVVSIYFLSNKHTLIRQIKKLTYAVVPSKAIDKVMEIATLTNSKFGKYIVGQLLDAFIIGICCFIGMTILKMPYAVLISVVVGCTNVIPFFGPFIGAIPSGFILLMVDPIKAVWFAIFILVLQQIDGNIIGPRVIGGSIGISGIWIMFSVIIGGGLFGIIGMVIGVPIFAVIYSASSDLINKRLKRKYMENFTESEIFSKKPLNNDKE